MSVFGQFLEIVDDAATIVAAPIKVGLEVVHAVTEPVAEVAEEIVEEVRDTLR